MKLGMFSKTAVSAWMMAALVTPVYSGPKPPEPPPLVVPKPKPAQISSSEGTLPLPEPGVMQKRQEKKNPPKPPRLLTKIRSADVEDWVRTPDDLKGLLEWMSTEMNVHFTSAIKGFNEATSDGEHNPILYRSG